MYFGVWGRWGGYWGGIGDDDVMYRRLVDNNSCWVGLNCNFLFLEIFLIYGLAIILNIEDLFLSSKTCYKTSVN